VLKPSKSHSFPGCRHSFLSNARMARGFGTLTDMSTDFINGLCRCRLGTPMTYSECRQNSLLTGGDYLYPTRFEIEVVDLCASSCPVRSASDLARMVRRDLRTVSHARLQGETASPSVAITAGRTGIMGSTSRSPGSGNPPKKMTDTLSLISWIRSNSEAAFVPDGYAALIRADTRSPTPSSYKALR
jgi:hypothetical protein